MRQQAAESSRVKLALVAGPDGFAKHGKRRSGSRRKTSIRERKTSTLPSTRLRRCTKWVRACTKWMEGRTGGLERRITYFGACKSRHGRFQPDGWTVARRRWNVGRKSFERASPGLTRACRTCGVARFWFGVCRPTGRGPKVFRARVHAWRACVHSSGAAVHVFRWRFKPGVECFKGRRAASQESPSPFRAMRATLRHRRCTAASGPRTFPSIRCTAATFSCRRARAGWASAVRAWTRARRRPVLRDRVFSCWPGPRNPRAERNPRRRNTFPSPRR